MHENRGRILRLCRAYAWNSADQDDLYQEIVLQSLARSKGPQRTTVRRHLALSRGAQHRDVLRPHSGHHAPTASFSSSTADLNARSNRGRQRKKTTDDRIADLYTAIYKLDPLEKALITLFLEDLTYEQIAEATGISANHVGVMLHRAKKKLSCLMMEEAPQ